MAVVGSDKRVDGGRLLVLPVAFWSLIRARIHIALRPDSVLMHNLRVTPDSAACVSLTPADRAWLADFSWALNGLARRMPFRADCLVRVLAARQVLGAKRWPFAIGIQAGRLDGEFTGHAWLTCDGCDVTGGPSEGLGVLVDPEVQSDRVRSKGSQ